MKKIFIGFGAVFIIALAAGAFLFISNNQNKNKPEPVTQENTITEPTTQTSDKTLRSLLSSALAQKCTYAETVEGSQANGTVYIGNGKMRSDINMVSGEDTIVSHTIFSDNTVYIWTGEQNTGLKMTFNPEEEIDAPETIDNPNNVDLDKELDYQCGPWIIDKTMFQLPANVEFNDMSGLLKNTQSTTPVIDSQTDETDTSAGNCSLCDSLPEEAKGPCLQSLNCN